MPTAAQAPLSSGRPRHTAPRGAARGPFGSRTVGPIVARPVAARGCILPQCTEKGASPKPLIHASGASLGDLVQKEVSLGTGTCSFARRNSDLIAALLTPYAPPSQDRLDDEDQAKPAE